MKRNRPLKRRFLSNAYVGRLYGKITQECTKDGQYSEFHYSSLAWHLDLPWYFAWHDNAQTIIRIREALERLERLRLISVKPVNHTHVLIKLQPRALQLMSADVRSIRKLLELEAVVRKRRQ